MLRKQQGVQVVLAVDWSGDAGFRIGQGSSDHLSIAIVAYDEDEISATLADLRHRNRRDPDHEFHFVKEPDRTRVAFMAALLPTSIEAIIVTVNKRALPVPPKLPRGDDFVAEIVCESTLKLSVPAVAGAVMVIDGGKDAKALCTQIREMLSQRMKAQNLDYRLAKVRPYRSHRSDGVMVADMLSGAARHAAQGLSPDFLAPLRGKVVLHTIP